MEPQWLLQEDNDVLKELNKINTKSKGFIKSGTKTFTRQKASVSKVYSRLH